VNRARRKRLAQVAFGGLVLVAVAWVWPRLDDPVSISDSGRPPGGSRELRFSGFGYAVAIPDGERMDLHARDLVLRKRRFGAFSVNPLREVLAHDVQMTIHRLPAAGPGDAGDADSKQRLFDLGDLSGLGLGTITRMLFTSMEVEIRREDAVEFRIVAESARVRSRRGELDLLGGVRVSSSSGERVSAREARLLDGGQRLRVWGPYEWRRGGEIRRASNAFFSLAAGGDLRLVGAHE